MKIGTKSIYYGIRSTELSFGYRGNSSSTLTFHGHKSQILLRLNQHQIPNRYHNVYDYKKNDVKKCFLHNDINSKSDKKNNENVTNHAGLDNDLTEHTPTDSNLKDPINSSDELTGKQKIAEPTIISSATSRAANALGSATLHYTYEFNRLYTDLEKSMLSKINESNKRRIRLIIVSVIVGTIILFVVFGSFIRKGITDGTADIAKETLENESLKIQTQELAMAVVQTILNDKDITSHAANFLREASSVPETQTALLLLTLHVLQHPDSLNQLTIMVQKIISILSKDPVSYNDHSSQFLLGIIDIVHGLQETIKYLSLLLSEAITDQRFVDTIVSMIGDLAVNPEIVKIFSELFISIAQRPEIVKVIHTIQ